VFYEVFSLEKIIAAKSRKKNTKIIQAEIDFFFLRLLRFFAAIAF
jgi:hypothetical protein